MGILDYGKKAIDPGGLLFNTGVAAQPGVGGAAGNPANLKQDPATGLYFDPTTGTTYTDPNGRQPVTDPNVAQQVAANYQRQSTFLGNAGQVFGQQQALAAHLNDVIAGKAPSVAGMTAAANLDQIANQQQAAASGVGGPTAPLARLMAERNIGAASVGANNAATMGRVAEETQANDALASLLSQTAGQQLGAGTAYGQMAQGGQEAQQNLNTQVQEQNAANRQKLIGAGTSALGSYLSLGKGSGGGNGGGGSTQYIGG